MEVATDLPSEEVMRIRVSGIDMAMAREKRAYAEYRVFTSIAAHHSHIVAVDVVVARESAADGRFRCSVSVDLGPSGGRVKTQARARHPSAAIDRAADRTAWLVARRVDFTLKSCSFSS